MLTVTPFWEVDMEIVALYTPLIHKIHNGLSGKGGISVHELPHDL